MLTKTEMQSILDQVNKRFDFLNNRIDELEKQLDKAKTTRPTKKVEENA